MCHIPPMLLCKMPPPPHQHPLYEKIYNYAGIATSPQYSDQMLVGAG